MGLPPSEVPGNSPPEVPDDAPAELPPDIPQEDPAAPPPETEPAPPTELPPGRPPQELPALGKAASAPAPQLLRQRSPLADAAALRTQIGLRSPEQAVALDILRDGKPMAMKAVLGATDQTLQQQRTHRSQIEQPLRLQGLSLIEDQRGVMVADVVPGSDAARAGMMAGDRIVSVEDTPIDRIDRLHAAIAAADPDDPVLIVVERQGTPFLLALP